MGDQLPQAPEVTGTHYFTNPYTLGVDQAHLEEIFFTKLHGPNQAPALNLQSNLTQLLPIISRGHYLDALFEDRQFEAYQQLNNNVIEILSSESQQDPTRMLHHALARFSVTAAHRLLKGLHLADARIHLFGLAERATSPNFIYVNNDRRGLLRCEVLNNLADLTLATKRPKQTGDALKQLGKLYQDFEYLPARDLYPQLAWSYQLQSRIAIDAGQLEKAWQLLDRAKQYNRGAGSAADPRQQTFDLNIDLEKAFVAGQLDHKAEARKLYSEVLITLIQIDKIRKEDRLAIQAQALLNRAMVNASLGRRNDQRKDLDEARPVAIELFEINPNAHLKTFGWAYTQAANYWFVQGRPDRPMELLLEAHAAIEAAEILETTHTAELIASIEFQIALYEQAKERWTESLIWLDRATQRIEPWEKSNPIQHGPDLIRYTIGKVAAYNKLAKGAQASLLAKAIEDRFRKLEGNLPPEQEQQLVELRKMFTQVQETTRPANRPDFERFLNNRFK